MKRSDCLPFPVINVRMTVTPYDKVPETLLQRTRRCVSTQSGIHTKVDLLAMLVDRHS